MECNVCVVVVDMTIHSMGRDTIIHGTLCWHHHMYCTLVKPVPPPYHLPRSPLCSPEHIQHLRQNAAMLFFSLYVSGTEVMLGRFKYAKAE